MTLNLEALKSALTAVLPILDLNVKNAYNEYMSGQIAAGAYYYVRDRHLLAHSVVKEQFVDAEVAYKACTVLAIDIRTGLKDQPNNLQWQQAELQWWDCFRSAGFTAVHPHFNFPVKEVSI